MSLNKHELEKIIPDLTRDYTTGSRHNKRKTIRLPPGREMRLDFPALCAEQFSDNHQTQK